MITGSVPTPSPGAIGDALTLLKVLDNPSAAQKMLANLHEAATKHDEQLAIVMARLKDAEAKEAALSSREAGIVARESVQNAREAKLGELTQAHQQLRDQLDQQAVSIAAREEKILQAGRELADVRAALDAEHRNRVAILDSQIAAHATEHSARMQALDDQEQVLVKRAVELKKNQDVLEARQAKLKEFLEV